MSDTGIRLPPLDNSSTRLHYREVEAATQRQRKTMKKLTCDKINAMCEIQSLKMRVGISEENNKEYRRQLDDMESVMKSMKEKHHMDVDTLKARQLELEKQVSVMKRQNKTHRELMSGLKIENEMLKRQLTNLQQKSGTIRPRTQTAKSQPYKSAKRTGSRSSSTKEFPRS